MLVGVHEDRTGSAAIVVVATHEHRIRSQKTNPCFDFLRKVWLSPGNRVDYLWIPRLLPATTWQPDRSPPALHQYRLNRSTRPKLLCALPLTAIHELFDNVFPSVHPGT